MVTESPVGERYIEREVETELREVHRKIIANESRIKLMRDLLEAGLCTRDIYSFACGQADICTTIFEPDNSTIVSAMRTKVRDLKQALKDDYRVRRRLEGELHKALGKRSWVTRRKIKNIKN